MTESMKLSILLILIMFQLYLVQIRVWIMEDSMVANISKKQVIGNIENNWKY